MASSEIRCKKGRKKSETDTASQVYCPTITRDGGREALVHLGCLEGTILELIAQHVHCLSLSCLCPQASLLLLFLIASCLFFYFLFVLKVCKPPLFYVYASPKHLRHFFCGEYIHRAHVVSNGSERLFFNKVDEQHFFFFFFLFYLSLVFVKFVQNSFIMQCVQMLIIAF